MVYPKWKPLLSRVSGRLDTASPKLRCAVHVKHILNSKTVKYSTNQFILITCLNDNFVIIFWPDFFKQLY